ncbi:MAG: flippase [Firmicutes bacterium]|nr:flippase [Bacillota bacterium]MBV1728018.1 flippase [Desulforudis sp.]MBV1735319.1 flippase [Desulforudis sp.]
MNKPLEIQGSLLARNTLLNLIGQGLPLVVAVVTMPFIIQGLGIERFGLLALAWVVLGYFAIFDLGLGRAATKFVAEALGKGEHDRVPVIAWTAVIVQATFGILAGFVLVGITPPLVERILNIPQELIGEARLSFYLLAPSIPVVLVAGSFRGVLEAAQRFDLVNAVRVPFSIASFLLPLVGVLLGWGLPGIIALLVVSRCLAMLIQYWLCTRVFPSFKGRPRFKRAELGVLLGFGGWITVTSTVGPIFAHLEHFLITSFLSIGALPFYAVPYKIVSQVVILPASMAMTIFPAFSYAGIDNYEKVKELFSRPFKYLLFGIVPIIVIFVAFASEILELWLGGEFAQKSTIILQILAIVFFFHAFAHIPLAAIQGLGRPDLKAKLDLVMLPIFVVLCLWFIPTLGLVGAALAKLLVTVIDVLYLSWMVKSLTKLPIREMFGERADKAVIIASLFTLAAFSFSILPKSLLADVAVLSSLIFGYVLLFVRIVMDDKDKSAFQSIRKYFQLGGGKV